MARILNETFYAKNVILWLDNAQMFFEEGTGSVDISNILLPVLEGGRLRVILTMDQQRYLEISSKKAALANAPRRTENEFYLPKIVEGAES